MHSETEDKHTAPDSVKIDHTSFGKDIEVVRQRNGRLFYVRMSNGGRLPNELKGRFTKFDLAVEAVKLYKARKNHKKTATKKAKASTDNEE